MAVADGFHVDSNGNLWLGSNRETFDATTRSEAPFYVYANGDMVANSGTFAGDLSAAGGTFSGNLSAAGGTFSGDLSAAGGTFSGDLSAAGGTFTGTISASNVTGGTLNFDNVTASNLDFTSLSIQAGDIVAQIATDEILGKISNGAISDAKLGSISASKISAGTLSGMFISGGSINVGNGFAADSGGMTAIGTVTIAPTSGSIGNGNVSITGGSGTFDSLGVTNNIFAGGTIRSNSYHSATRYYDISSSSNMDLASSFVYLKPGDNFGLNVSTSTSTIYSTFQPSTNGGKNLGNSNRRWATVFRISESSTSDERLKENIIDIDYGLDFVNDLRPREFTWKSMSSGFSCDICGQIYESVQECNSEIKSVDENDEEVLIDCTGTVTEQFTEADDKHTFGFIAQEMLPELGTSKLYNLVNHDTESDEYNYSQENLIAPLVKAVQELSAKNDELELRIAALEG